MKHFLKRGLYYCPMDTEKKMFKDSEQNKIDLNLKPDSF